MTHQRPVRDPKLFGNWVGQEVLTLNTGSPEHAIVSGYDSKQLENPPSTSESAAQQQIPPPRPRSTAPAPARRIPLRSCQ